MSDKPIYAEVVRASELKPGDRFAWLDVIATVETVEVLADSGSVYVAYNSGSYTLSTYYYPTTFVARILPDPVEVREFWRVRYKRYYYTPDGVGYATRCTDSSPTREIAIERFNRRLPAGPEEGEPLVTSATIEHVRETIISRERVQP